MTTYVLIPGMCHGAWCFDDLGELGRLDRILLDAVADRRRLWLWYRAQRTADSRRREEPQADPGCH